MNPFSKAWVGTLLALPALLLLGAVIVVPELWALLVSLSEARPGQPLVFVGLGNYRRILGDPNFWNAVRNTFTFLIVAVGLQLVLGVAFALLLGRGFPGQRLWIAAVLAPSAMSPAVLGASWKYMFQPDIGPVNHLLSLLGVEPFFWLGEPFWAFVAVIIVYTWNTVPQTFIFVYPALISIPREYFEAARVDGARPWQTFVHVTLPLLRTALLVALIFRTIISFRAFGEVWVLTQGGPFRATELLSIFLYKEGFVYFSWGTAAAVGWAMLLLTMVFAAPQIRAIARQMVGEA